MMVKMCRICSTFLSLFLLTTTYTNGFSLPANGYEFSLKRDELIRAERNYQGKKNTLTSDEQLVGHYLQHLKWKEFQRTRDNFLPSISLNSTIKDEILQTEVYKTLLSMPKGGNMHTHENHEVSRKTVLEIVWKLNDFQYLWMTDPETSAKPWTFKFGVNSPPGDKWIKVKDSNYSSITDVLPHQTLFGIMSDFARKNPTNTGRRWKDMNPLWGQVSPLLNHHQVKREYLMALYDKSLKEGVQYLETKSAVGRHKIYKVDPSVKENNGIVYLERDENIGEMDINITQKAVMDFIRQHQSFIGHKRLSYTSRKHPVEKMQTAMDRAIALHRKYPKHLIGFDLVGEEDAGNSHIFFLENFLMAGDAKTGKSKIPFYPHTAETNWPGDLITGKQESDPVATLKNAYEAILLGSKRVGHGLGYIKHPFLLRLLKERDVAVEVCPISNQILGYIVDLRNHPAINFIRNGVPVVLGTDDPGSFGYDHFTIDWYAIFMAWGLDLWDLKHLSESALMYSGMTKMEKSEAMQKFKATWVEYIKNTKKKLCAKKYKEKAIFSRIFPRVGLKVGNTMVHVFGRDFDKALNGLCNGKSPMCYFGVRKSPAVYISNTHLVCKAPPPSAGQMTVKVKVSIEGDDNLEDTQEVFTYNQESSGISKVSFSLVIMITAVVFSLGVQG